MSGSDKDHSIWFESAPLRINRFFRPLLVVLFASSSSLLAQEVLAKTDLSSSEASNFPGKRLSYSSTASDHRPVGEEAKKDGYNTLFEISITAKDPADNILVCIEAPDDVTALGEARSLSPISQFLSMGVQLQGRTQSPITECWSVKHMSKGQSLVLQYDGVRIVSDPKVAKSSNLAIRVNKGFFLAPVALSYPLLPNFFQGFAIAKMSASSKCEHGPDVGPAQLETTSAVAETVKSTGCMIEPTRTWPPLMPGPAVLSSPSQQDRQTPTDRVPAAPHLMASVSPTSLSFTYTATSGPSTQTVTITNQGVGPLLVTAATTSDAATWLSVTPSDGIVNSNEPMRLAITTSPGGLLPGIYASTISIRIGDDSVTVPVAMSVVSTPVPIQLSQAGLTFAAIAHGAPPPAQTFAVLNAGQSSLNWSVAAPPSSGGNWLSVSPSNTADTVAQPSSGLSLFTVTVNTAGLLPGSYFGSIQLNRPGIPVAQALRVSLSVLPSGLGQAIESQLSVVGLAGIGNTASAPDLPVTDTSDNRIYMVSNGSVSTLAGGGISGFRSDADPATTAPLGITSGIAIDSTGNLYIADTYNNQIRKVSNGILTTVAGNGGSGFSGDYGPATSAQLSMPMGVAVDSAGNLYIADSYNNRIRRVSNGVIITVAGNGEVGFSGDNGQATSAQLDIPMGVAVDSAGNLYIADTYNNRIRMVSNGVITTIAGSGGSAFSGDDGPATRAQLSMPIGVSVDSADNLYIADSYNNRIRKVSDGVIVTEATYGRYVFGGTVGSAASGQLNLSSSAFFGSAGNVLITNLSSDQLHYLSPLLDAGNIYLTNLSGGDTQYNIGVGLTPAASGTVITIYASGLGQIDQVVSSAVPIGEHYQLTVQGDNVHSVPLLLGLTVNDPYRPSLPFAWSSNVSPGERSPGEPLRVFVVNGGASIDIQSTVFDLDGSSIVNASKDATNGTPLKVNVPDGATAVSIKSTVRRK